MLTARGIKTMADYGQLNFSGRRLCAARGRAACRCRRGELAGCPEDGIDARIEAQTLLACSAQPGCRLSAYAAPVPYGLLAGTSCVLAGSHICVSHPLWGAGLTSRYSRGFRGNLLAVAGGE